MIIADRIVQFTNNNNRTVYAIERSFLFFKVYKDLTSYRMSGRSFWWRKSNRYFKDCLTTDKDVVLNYMKGGREHNKFVKANSRKPVTVEQLMDEPDEIQENNRLERLGVSR